MPHVPPPLRTADALDTTRSRATRALLDEVTAEDGTAPVDEAGLLLLDAPAGRGTHLLAESDEGILGYAGVQPDGTVQGAVRPDRRRRGLGSALLAASLDATGTPAVWSHGALPDAVSFLTRRGLEAVRTLLVLDRPLPAEAPAPDAEERSGVTLSTWTDADAEEFLALNAAVFADHPEQGQLDAEGLAERTSQPWFDADGFFLARDRSDGSLAGYVWTKIEPDGEAGEIYVVGTGAAHRGRGIASLLVRHGLAHIHRAGRARALLYVEGDNAAALATYERLGFAEAERHMQFVPRGDAAR